MTSSTVDDDNDFLTSFDRSIELDFGEDLSVPSLTKDIHKRLNENNDEVIHTCTNTLKTNPDDLQTRMLRGLTYLRQHDYIHAMSDFDSCIIQSNSSHENSNPHDSNHRSTNNPMVASLYSRGVCLAGLQRFEEAVTDFTECLRLAPDHFNAAFGRAACYNATGFFSKAIEDYHYALSREEELFHQADTSATDRRRRRMLDMDHLRYDTAYDTDQGHEILRAFMPPPPSRAGGIGTSGNVAMSDDMQRAQAALDAACKSLGINTTPEAPIAKKTSTNANGSVATAAILTSPTSPRPIKRPPTTPYIHTSPIPNTSPLPTIEGAKASSASGSSNFQLLADESHSRGYLLRLQGRYTDAIVHYDRALALFPMHFKARFNRAFAMDKLDRVDDAIEEYSYALQLLDLEQLHHDDDENDYENSSNNVEATSISPALRQHRYHNNKIHRAFVHYNRGICLDRLGRLPAAVDDFTKAIDAHPHAQHIISPVSNIDTSDAASHSNTTHANALADFYHNRGFALLKLKHHHQAISDFQVALGLRPMHLPTTRYLQLCKDQLQQVVESSIRQIPIESHSCP